MHSARPGLPVGAQAAQVEILPRVSTLSLWQADTADLARKVTATLQMNESDSARFRGVDLKEDDWRHS